MSTLALVGERIEGYTSALKGVRDSDITPKESFDALKASIESFITGLSSFQILRHIEGIQGLQLGLASQAERFTDVGSTKRPSGIPNETKFWPPQELKDLHRRVEDLEANPSEHSAEEAQLIAQEVEEFQSTHTLSTVLSSSGVIGELKERVTALQTPPSLDAEETHIIEESVDMEEVVEEPEVEQGSSFWKKAGALALIGLVLFAPAAAILAPMLMGSSNSTAPETSFDMPRGGTQTNFSSTPINMPNIQSLNSANGTSTTPTIIEPPASYANATLPPVDITTLQPTSNPVSFKTPVSYANSTMTPVDTTTFQPVTTPTGMTPHTPIADSTDPTQVRYVDRATLRGDEMIPAGEGDITVIEYDSRAPKGLELPSSAETVVGSTIPAITDSKEATTPVFDPLTLLNTGRTAQFSMPTSSKVHSTGLLRLPAPPADTQRSVTTPPSINTVASLDPRARLTLHLSVPSLDLRDVCAANHTNSTITT